jgi:hypothetical protein
MMRRLGIVAWLLRHIDGERSRGIGRVGRIVSVRGRHDDKCTVNGDN